jgi:hypothetical protein
MTANIKNTYKLQNKMRLLFLATDNNQQREHLHPVMQRGMSVVRQSKETFYKLQYRKSSLSYKNGSQERELTSYHAEEIVLVS